MESLKINLTSKEALISYVKDNQVENYLDNRLVKKNIHVEDDLDLFDKKDDEITSTTFNDIAFKGDLHYFEFSKCHFVDCNFEGFYGFFLIFNQCKFYKCNFRNSKFSHIEFAWNEVEFVKCLYQNVEWYEAGLYNIFFTECYLQNFRVVDVNPIRNVHFHQCTFDRTSFEYIGNTINEEDDDDGILDLHLEKCKFNDTNFNSTDLRNSIFENSVLYKCNFFDSTLSEETFYIDEELENTCYASMDFQTILKSDVLDKEMLSFYFKIVPGIDLKKMVSTMTTEVPFYTLFISYSLKDKNFAQRLNDALVKRNAHTFLWEKDAPVGKTLEEIMSNGVRKHQKLLFIASENSIRSKACQFELSEGRKKQEELWDTIFFPIHIDNYLFNVQKRDIRPVNMANEFWENIEELKRVNSMDFTKFNEEDIEENEFEEAIDKLISQALKSDFKKCCWYFSQ